MKTILPLLDVYIVWYDGLKPPNSIIDLLPFLDHFPKQGKLLPILKFPFIFLSPLQSPLIQIHLTQNITYKLYINHNKRIEYFMVLVFDMVGVSFGPITSYPLKSNTKKEDIKALGRGNFVIL
jgi:hypothetical protein